MASFFPQQAGVCWTIFNLYKNKFTQNLLSFSWVLRWSHTKSNKSINKFQWQPAPSLRKIRFGKKETALSIAMQTGGVEAARNKTKKQVLKHPINTCFVAWAFERRCQAVRFELLLRCFISVFKHTLHRKQPWTEDKERKTPSNFARMSKRWLVMNSSPNVTSPGLF